MKAKTAALCGMVTMAYLLVTASAGAYKAGVCSGECTNSPVVGYTNITAANAEQHPEVVLIFWQDCAGCGPNGAGLQWTNGTARPTQTQFIGMELSLINSAYFAGLGQYGHVDGASGWSSGQIGRPRLSPMTPIITGYENGHNTAQATETDILDIVTTEINGVLVPSPPTTNRSDNLIYLVVTPDTSVSYCSSNGCNDYVPGGYKGNDIVIGQVNAANPGPTLAHESLEAIATWNGTVVTNCVDDGLADICGCYSETWSSGLSIQPYWSAQDGACIVPESWGSLYVNANQGAGWTVPAGDLAPRQVYGGGGGMVVTDTTDRVYYYSQSQGGFWGQKPPFCIRGQTCWSAVSFGGAAAEFAAGGSVVAALGQNAQLDVGSGVEIYELTQGQGGFWSNIGKPPASPPGVTSIAVTSGGVVVASDTLGKPWYYWSGSWVNFAVPGDEFVASQGNIIALTPQLTSAWEWSGSNFGHGGSWFEVYSLGGASIMQLIGNPDAPQFGFVLQNNVGFTPYAADGDYSFVYPQGVDFAVSSANSGGTDTLLTNLSLDVYDCVGMNCYSPPWSNAYGVGGRLISGLDMYVTGSNGNGGSPAVYNY